ncbi:MAG: hypothetical protein EOP80_03095 [Variovorax sp.]|nr:MAG: hypothetical protein EOP80_03095 [Variovorax sp.]
MNAIKTARKSIEAQPGSGTSRTLARLVLALESEGSFDVADLDTLPPDSFALALKIVREWRRNSRYAGKAKLFDLSLQVSMLPN